MKRNDNQTINRYFSPECLDITIEVEGRFLAASSVVLDTNGIKDPTWNTSGDYGLE